MIVDRPGVLLVEAVRDRVPTTRRVSKGLQIVFVFMKGMGVLQQLDPVSQKGG